MNNMLKQEIRSIVILRALQIGDMLCWIPAVRAIHKAFPEATITLVGLPWAKMLVERFPEYIHELIQFPGYPGFPEQQADLTAYPAFLREIQSRNFDLAIQMQGSGIISNPVIKLFNAKSTAGFYLNGNYCPDPELFVKYPSHLHEVERHLSIAEKLGATDLSREMEFPLTDKDELDFAESALPVKPKEYVVLHPGSRDVARQWDTANFAAIGDFCSSKGLKVVITGTADEQPIVKAVVNKMKAAPIIAAGKTSLGAVAVLIKNAAALVSNCTGVSHIAAGLKTKSIVISLDGEPDRWGPLNKQVHRTIDWPTTPDFDLVQQELNNLLFGSLQLNR